MYCYFSFLFIQNLGDNRVSYFPYVYFFRRFPCISLLIIFNISIVRASTHTRFAKFMPLAFATRLRPARCKFKFQCSCCLLIARKRYCPAGNRNRSIVIERDAWSRSVNRYSRNVTRLFIFCPDTRRCLDDPDGSLGCRRIALRDNVS